MFTAFLGLGSNIEAPANIRSAMIALKDRFGAVAFSPVYRSAAMGFEGDDFLNLVARIDTDLLPLELVAWLHELEDRHGRDRSVPRWSSRTLDVDILLFGDLWLRSPALEIPRMEITSFAHVLKPLVDLEPDLVHPVEQLSLGKLWAAFPKQNLELEPVHL